MKTEQEIIEEIKQRTKLFWNATYFTKDQKQKAFNRLCNYVSGLLWVLHDYSNKEVCPYCGSIMECDTVDIGIGYQQCGPYHCEDCGASEIHHTDTLEIDEDEEMTGYYKNRISPIANTCCGHLVSHVEVKRLYKNGLLDNCKPSYIQ